MAEVAAYIKQSSHSGILAFEVVLELEIETEANGNYCVGSGPSISPFRESSYLSLILRRKTFKVHALCYCWYL